MPAHPPPLRLDPLTLLFCIACLALLMALTSWGLARMPHSRRVYGLERWAQAMAVGGCAMLLLMLRGHVPMWLSFLLGNMLVALYPALCVAAHAQLFQQPTPWRWLLPAIVIGLAGVAGVHAGWLPFRMAAASMAASLAMELAVLMGLLWRRQRGRLSAVPLGVLALLGLLVIAFTLRAWRAWTGELPLAGDDAAAGFRPQPASLVLSALFALGGSMGFFHLVHQRQSAEAAERARRDGLTGLYTRSAFFEQAAGRLRLDGPFAVLMVDLDHFKQVNDSLGHQGGDRVLAHAARCIAQALRPDDVAGRYGGEEFCVLLPGCTPAQARALAERLVREAAAQRVRLDDGREAGYTLSAGWCTSHPAAALTLQRAIARADEALYAAKRAGRNRAVGAGAAAAATAERADRFGPADLADRDDRDDRGDQAAPAGRDAPADGVAALTASGAAPGAPDPTRDRADLSA